MKTPVPPAEVSRMPLLGFVAAGAIVSIATSGQLSAFAGGFAVGSGTALMVSRLKRPAAAGEPGPDEDGS